MRVETSDQLEGMLAAGRVVRSAFNLMRSACVPGITTQALDDIGAAEISRCGARSAPRMYYDFPGATCISVNCEAAHGIPGGRVLGNGDMVNIDVSAHLDGYVADMGQSFVVGTGSAEQHRICTAVEAAVTAAIGALHAGCSLNVIGAAVARVARQEGYSIVENLGSHGVGSSLHEEPSYVPLDNPQEQRQLQNGTVLTIEPFFSTGITWVDEAADGWTLTVPAGHLVAQFEHTVIVTAQGAIVVTADPAV